MKRIVIAFGILFPATVQAGFDLNAGMNARNRAAINSLSRTGELPGGPKWDALRDQREKNETRFDRNNPLLGALLRRDEQQKAGLLSSDAPLFDSSMPKYGQIMLRFERNPFNFTKYHPFLGRLLAIKLPGIPDGPNPPFPPIDPVNPVNPIPPSVPEPSSMIMCGIAMTAGFGEYIRRKIRRTV